MGFCTDLGAVCTDLGTCSHGPRGALYEPRLDLYEPRHALYGPWLELHEPWLELHGPWQGADRPRLVLRKGRRPFTWTVDRSVRTSLSPCTRLAYYFSNPELGEIDPLAGHFCRVSAGGGTGENEFFTATPPSSRLTFALIRGLNSASLYRAVT